MRARTRSTASSMAASEIDGSGREKRAGWDGSPASRAENALAIETFSEAVAALTGLTSSGTSSTGTAAGNAGGKAAGEDSGSTIAEGSGGAGFFGMSQSPNDAG